MSTSAETYAIANDESDFVGVHYRATKELVGDPYEVERSVWFARSNLAWLVRALETTLDEPQPGTLVVNHGGDDLRVLEGGHEAEPYIHITNERPDDAAHGGGHWVSLTKRIAQKLTADLAELLSRS
ncbi:MAG TPA: hypothetical protein VGG74_16525 [Kofleriaceae bacterium]|jgi:hypothetical protein